MLKRMTLVCLTAMLSSLLTSCFLNPDEGDPPVEKPQGYVELTSREAVLNNLEVSYNRRHINKYQEVLDENFTFFFYSGDVGGDIPAQWGRQEEIDSNRNMFDPNWEDPDQIQPAVKKIFMDVKWENDKGESIVQWQTVQQGSGENWFMATVFYNFQIDVGENDHFINNSGSKARFTVRNAGTADAPHWQLVEFEDLDQDL